MYRLLVTSLRTLVRSNVTLTSSRTRTLGMMTDVTTDLTTDVTTDVTSDVTNDVTNDVTTDVTSPDDDVTFGILDRKFLDSKSLKQLAQSRGAEARKFEPRTNEQVKEGVQPRENRPRSYQSETFGTLWTDEDFRKKHTDLTIDKDAESEGEDDHHIRLSKFDRKHQQTWYDNRLIKLSKRGQVVEAVRFLKEEMIGKDRVLPSKISYTVVVSTLAKAGYTDLAFNMFYEMRERGIKAPKQVFSALFNACANCPDKAKGLRQAHYLRDYMKRKDSPTHYITYKAQMKAFAWTGDVRTAFSTLDEALEAGNRLDQEACSMLLMACVSDRKNGFLHAVKVWRVMMTHGLRPDIHQYNLLTRCVLECGLHDTSQLQQLLVSGPGTRTGLPSSGEVNLVAGPGTRIGEPPSGEVTRRDLPRNESTNLSMEEDLSLDTKQECTEMVNTNLTPAIPDILSLNPISQNFLGFQPVTKATDRLSLIGGVSGLLVRMRADNVRPDIKTFSMLVDCVESDTSSEEGLMSAMQEYGVVPDTPFCNLLMRRRVFRQEVQAAKAVLELMGSHQLLPDLHTYATLALTCSTKVEATQLLDDIEAHDVAPTTEVFSHLNQAAYMNFNYRQWLCREMEEREILPDELFIRQCEKRIREARKMLLDWDRMDRDTERERNFRRKFKQFHHFYEHWLRRTGLRAPPREPRRVEELKTRQTSQRLEFTDHDTDTEESVEQ